MAVPKVLQILVFLNQVYFHLEKKSAIGQLYIVGTKVGHLWVVMATKPLELRIWIDSSL